MRRLKLYKKLQGDCKSNGTDAMSLQKDEPHEPQSITLKTYFRKLPLLFQKITRTHENINKHASEPVSALFTTNS